MAVHALSTEVILAHSHQCLGKVQLDWMPQPGSSLDFAGHTYLVLERRHCYQFRAGRYQLDKIYLVVQSDPAPTERSEVAGRWVLGDVTCQFNARSELIRCAVNPGGPCSNCRDYRRLLDDGE